MIAPTPNKNGRVYSLENYRAYEITESFKYVSKSTELQLNTSDMLVIEAIELDECKAGALYVVVVDSIEYPAKCIIRNDQKTFNYMHTGEQTTSVSKVFAVKMIMKHIDDNF